MRPPIKDFFLVLALGRGVAKACKGLQYGGWYSHVGDREDTDGGGRVDLKGVPCRQNKGRRNPPSPPEDKPRLGRHSENESEDGIEVAVTRIGFLGPVGHNITTDRASLSHAFSKPRPHPTPPRLPPSAAFRRLTVELGGVVLVNRPTALHHLHARVVHR